MLKKLFKIGMLASLIAVACTANAQEEKQYQLEYPRYGFWSNWSLGGSVMYSWEFQHGGIFDWRDGSNIGGAIFVEKELSHIWAARLIVQTPGFWKGWREPLPEGAYNRETGIEKFDRYGKVGVDFKMSFQGLFKGYDPDRRGNLYLFAGMGAALSRQDVDGGIFAEYFNGGLGWSYKCCDKFTFFTEVGIDCVADLPAPFHQWHDCTGWVALGGMFNFGPTQADLDLIAQRAMLTQENFDRLNNEIEGLRKDLREAKEREAKLVNRINELEDQLANQQVVKADDGTADSLRKVIESYENNKHNFYAMPFSILYGVDQYTVSADQMDKINAIVKIMKEDESINYEIIGYCDYSGSDAYNQKLSEKRAEYVKKLLVRKGIAEDRLTTSGKGKTLPFGDVKNAVNRRVSFYRTNN